MAQKRKQITVEDVIEFVMEPGSDSEMSELMDSDDDEEYIPDERIANNDVELVSDEENETEADEVPDNQQREETSDADPETVMKKDSDKKKPRAYRWRKKEPVVFDTSFKGSNFSPPPDNADKLTPLNYFKMFWNDEINAHLSHHTNLYSTQETGKSIVTDPDEIEVFFGIQMTMAIIKMSQYKMYWSPQLRCDRIASRMKLNRYETLRKFLHANDNNKKNDPENINDKLFKVRPLLDMVRDNCLKIEPEQCHSIDEQIIPAKTKRSGGVKQYNPQKIHKWGFKNMVRAGKSGIMYDFFLYAGKHSAGAENCGAEKSVLRLVENIPKNQNYRVYFDNWFSTLALLDKLDSMGILAAATFRTNRVANCPLLSDKDLKASGRGSSDYRIDLNSKMRMLKWFDNKTVILGSNYASIASSTKKRRWDAKKKEFCNIDYPDMVRDYNESMGGVDLADMLISLYRVDIQTRKRWYLKIITHCINICNVNAWLLYRRFSEQLQVPKKSQLTYLQFIKDVADGLLMAGKQPGRTPGRPKKRSLSPVPKVGKKPMVPKPIPDVRYDGLNHWPTFAEKRNRCRLCSILSFVYCSKCNMHLCLQKDRNCFHDFHN